MIDLTPDREMLGQFALLMFKRARHDGFVSLRAFPDKKKEKKEKPIFIDPIRIGDFDFLEITTERARQAATWHEPAVFCPPVVTFRDSKNAKTDNIFEGVCLSVECDQSPHTARSTLEALLGTATAVVASGGEWINPATGEIEPKVHLHWRLTKPTSTKTEHDLLKEARALATKLVGGDDTNISIVHPIRWPGSWHRKSTPRLAETIAFSDDNEIDLVEAVGRLRDAAGTLDFNQAGVKANGKLEADDHAAVAAALAVIPNDKLEWADWNRIGMATWAATGGSDAGREAFHAWSAKSPKNDPAATEARWQHYVTSPPTSIGFGTLIYLARKYSPGWTYGSAGPVEPVDLWAKFDPPSLPRGLLPAAIEAFTFERSAVMGCDPTGLAFGALAVCAASIPEDIRIQPKQNDTKWQESARIWIGLVGGVSEMKSPILDTVAARIRDIDYKMEHAYQEALGRWLALPKKVREKKPKPKHLRAKIMNTTVEAAADILKDSPDGVLLEQDELSGWFGSMDKYAGSRGAQADRAFWLQSFNGKPYTVDRVVRGSTYIPHLSVSILGFIQPEPIRKIADSGEDDGLMQRFIIGILCPAVKGGDAAPGQALFDYEDLIENLRKLKPPQAGKLAPPDPVTFDAGALKIRNELDDRHRELSQCKTINRKLTSHVGKYNGLFARLCLIWHCIEHVDDAGLPAVITEHTARRVADFLHGFLFPHALAFYAGVLGLANDHDVMADVAGYILAHNLKVITSRDVQRGTQNMRRFAKLDKRNTEGLFEQLEAFGWVTRTPGARPSDSPQWMVNPVVHQKFEALAKAEKERRAREVEMIRRMCA